jgi:glycosyltransferase involved in cell wall biosynthesis
MTARPLISVLLPAYNVAPYVRAAVASVQNQTLGEFELIIVNDGSTDATLPILQELAAQDTRIKIISRPNTGIVGALNDAIAAANAPYIARMDGDDLCLPNRFEHQLTFLKANPEVLLVGAEVEFIDSRGKRLKTYRPPHDGASIQKALLEGNSGALIHPAIMGPRRAWTETGGYRQPYNYVEDYDLYLRAARLGPLANFDAPLLQYRIHAQSTNYLRREQQIALLKQLCQDARTQAGLEGAFDLQPAPAHPDLASVYREWAWWAVEGGERSTARHYAWKAVCNRPWQAANIRCLRQILISAR